MVPERKTLAATRIEVKGICMVTVRFWGNFYSRRFFLNRKIIVILVLLLDSVLMMIICEDTRGMRRVYIDSVPNVGSYHFSSMPPSLYLTSTIEGLVDSALQNRKRSKSNSQTASPTEHHECTSRLQPNEPNIKAEYDELC